MRALEILSVIYLQHMMLGKDFEVNWPTYRGRNLCVGDMGDSCILVGRLTGYYEKVLASERQGAKERVAA